MPLGLRKENVSQDHIVFLHLDTQTTFKTWLDFSQGIPILVILSNTISDNMLHLASTAMYQAFCEGLYMDPLIPSSHPLQEVDAVFPHLTGDEIET